MRVVDIDRYAATLVRVATRLGSVNCMTSDCFAKLVLMSNPNGSAGKSGSPCLPSICKEKREGMSHALMRAMQSAMVATHAIVSTRLASNERERRSDMAEAV